MDVQFRPRMYGRILRHLRESKSRSQADVARSVGISPAHLARLESNQRGLYVEDFVHIAEVLGEKPGNLLPNDLGDIGRLKPIIDRLASVKPESLGRIAAILEQLVLLADQDAETSPHHSEPKRTPAPKRPRLNQPSPR